MHYKIMTIGVFVTFLFSLAGCGSNDTPSSAIASPIAASVSVSPTSAPVGAAVTITATNGMNFSTTPANNAVSFNGTSSVVTSCTPTVIVTTVPAGATTGLITVSYGASLRRLQPVLLSLSESRK